MRNRNLFWKIHFDVLNSTEGFFSFIFTYVRLVMMKLDVVLNGVNVIESQRPNVDKEDKIKLKSYNIVLMHWLEQDKNFVHLYIR